MPKKNNSRVNGRGRGWRKTPVADRFWPKVDKDGPGGCWLWTGRLTEQGYARTSINRIHVPAHRWSYEQSKGPIPDGLELDHLCRVRHCVNPDHLEAVTHTENVRRGMSPKVILARNNICQNGHPLKGDNVKIDTRGFRRCRTCHRSWQRMDRPRMLARKKASGICRRCSEPSAPDRGLCLRHLEVDRAAAARKRELRQ